MCGSSCVLVPEREQGRVMDFAMKAPVILDLPKCRNVSGISSGRWPSRSATSAFVTRLNLEPAHFLTNGAKGGYFCKLVCSRWKYHITFTAMFFLVWEMIKGGDNGTCWAWHVRRALRYCLWRWLHSNLQHCFEKGGCSWYFFAWDCLGGRGLQACLVAFLSDMFGSANEFF